MGVNWGLNRRFGGAVSQLSIHEGAQRASASGKEL